MLQLSGCLLAGMTSASHTITFDYDHNGRRVRKTYDGVATDYTYNGNLLVHMTKGADTLHFYYDAQGCAAMVNYNGTNYHYLHNLQGDVIGLVDSTSALVVEYKYNAWGSVLGKWTLSTEYSNLASMNPFRYRGYVYDEETWMYYCRARYYYPELQRWISADSVMGMSGALLSHNPYCYCNNEIISFCDHNGRFGLSITLGLMAIGGIIGAVVGATTSIAVQMFTEDDINWKSVGIAAASGFVSGVVAASPLGIFGQTLVGGFIGSGAYIADCYVNDKEVEIDNLAVSFALGAWSGAIGGAGANEDGTITKVVNTALDTIKREFRRNNQQYAQKAIERTASYAMNRISLPLWSMAGRMTLGGVISGSLSVLYLKHDKDYLPLYLFD